ncbi:MAG: ice-binding family protein [Candidatus Eremiobacteraeota bacterium]|nr:ice-binding family protein [Candidatus Eremiobacteraeota bacterium]
MVIAPGTYRAPVSLAITGNVTLDGQNNPNAVFIFQIGP